MRHGSQLDDESLCTFMTEAEAIVNCRPLTVDNLSSPEGVEPLTPTHLLTMKSSVILPPPGSFQVAALVRKVKLLVADSSLDRCGKRSKPPVYLDRPVQKLVILLQVMNLD